MITCYFSGCNFLLACMGIYRQIDSLCRSSFDVTQSTKLERSLANGVDDINDESKL